MEHLINGVVPRNAPPPDYYSMMRGILLRLNNLNQIAQKAHTLNVIDVQRYGQGYEVRRNRRLITEAVILPEQQNNGNHLIWSIKGWLGKVVIYVENPKRPKIGSGKVITDFRYGNRIRRACPM